jgi:hypothetical protein
VEKIMRLSSIVLCLSVCAFAATPSLLCAQFAAPTSQELGMTSDPKAPGADAVYLNVEESTNDQVHYQSVYAKLKILTENGLRYASVELPLRSGDAGSTGILIHQMHNESMAGNKSDPASDFKVTEFHARTVQSDGSVVPLNLKPGELKIVKADANGPDRIAFTLPEAKAGSILEYRCKITYGERLHSSPNWQVQRPLFVHKAHYLFTPYNDFQNNTQLNTFSYLVDAHGKPINTLIWSPVLPAGAAVKQDPQGDYLLDVDDVAALPAEPWMPPSSAIAYHVRFYYKNATSPSEFWATESKLWSKDVDKFAETTSTLRRIADQQVAPTDSDQVKAHKLYKVVQGLENTSFTGGAAATNSTALDVLDHKRGTSQELAQLYLALLRAEGIRAWLMAVVSRDHGVYASSYLSFDQFDSDLVIAYVQGKEIFLDPGEALCPFQTLSWKHAGASGIRQSAAGTATGTSPLLTYAATTILRTGELAFDTADHYSGTFRFVLSGQQALLWRQMVQRSGKETAKTTFDVWLATMTPAGARASFDHFLALEDPELNLVAVVNIEGKLSGSAQQPTLPAYFFAAGATEPFVDAALRTQPIDMHFPNQITDQVTYDLPEGFTVVQAPAPVKISGDRFGAFATGVKQEPGKLTVLRQVTRNFTLAAAADYASIRGFYQKIAAIDQQTVSLAPSAKSN